jgi:ferredoxin hydrogenase large subunit/hydrogenase large subunit
VFSESDNSSKTFLPSGVFIDGKLAPFDESAIREDIKYSRYASASGFHPSQGKTKPEPNKSGAYSWLKSPRYNGHVVEVGPLARIMIAYHGGSNSAVTDLVNGLCQKLGMQPTALFSVMGRHAARAIECKIVADRCVQWLAQLKPDAPTFKDFNVAETGKGIGLTEAPRGALGHWLELQNHRISNYQCVVPTTWNCSPRDDKGKPGAAEQALIGTSIMDKKNPIEAARVVRSFDPCIACAVH